MPAGRGAGSSSAPRPVRVAVYNAGASEPSSFSGMRRKWFDNKVMSSSRNLKIEKEKFRKYQNSRTLKF